MSAAGCAKCHTEALQQSFPGLQRFILSIYCCNKNHRYAAADQQNQMVRNAKQSISDQQFPTRKLPAIQFGPHLCSVTPRERPLIKLEAVP
jgi:hypothetical protein